MPYTTATPVRISGREVSVTFSGPGVPPRDDVFNGVGTIEDWARNIVSRLNTPTSKTPVQTGVPLDLTPPAAVPPSARQAYERDRAAVLQDEEDLRNRVTTAANPKLAANLAAAQASRTAYDAQT